MQINITGWGGNFLSILAQQSFTRQIHFHLEGPENMMAGEENYDCLESSPSSISHFAFLRSFLAIVTLLFVDFRMEIII